MPTATYTALANVTLTATASSITFSSIPGTYRDLVLVVSCLGSGSFGRVLITLNGSGSSSGFIFMSGTGAAETSGQNTPDGNRLTVFSTGSAAPFAQINASIMDYSATDKFKTVLSRASKADSSTDAVVMRRSITAAVTSLSISAGGWGIGTSAALYGIVS